MDIWPINGCKWLCPMKPGYRKMASVSWKWWWTMGLSTHILFPDRIWFCPYSSPTKVCWNHFRSFQIQSRTAKSRFAISDEEDKLKQGFQVTSAWGRWPRWGNQVVSCWPWISGRNPKFLVVWRVPWVSLGWVSGLIFGEKSRGLCAIDQCMSLHEPNQLNQNGCLRSYLTFA